MQQLWTYIADNREQILRLLGQHVEFSVLSVVLSILIAVPLGLLCRASRILAQVLLNAVSLIYTIPTLALFGLMIPLLGIGWVPAVAAIVLYSLLPIAQNTYTGLLAVPLDAREAARGMGMSAAQMLLRVELPLALSLIFAGIRVAAVNAVGMVTIASFIGAGGLGDLIFRGISTVSTVVVVTGSVPVLVMAIGADILLRRVERALALRMGEQLPEGGA
jgi:osmoprotectant transport system permease protein